MFGKIIPVRPPTTASRVKLLQDRINFLRGQLTKIQNMRAQGRYSADEAMIRSVPINGEIYQLTQLVRGSRIQPASYDESSMWWTQRRGETNKSARGGYNYSSYTPAAQQTAASKPAKKYVSESYHVPTAEPATMSVPQVSTNAMQYQTTSARSSTYDYGDVNEQARSMPDVSAPTHSTASEVNVSINPFVDEDTRFLDDVNMNANLTADQFFNMVDDIITIDGRKYVNVDRSKNTVVMTPQQEAMLKSPTAVNARPLPHVTTMINNVNNALLARARLTPDMISILNKLKTELIRIQQEIATAMAAAASAAASKAEAEELARKEATAKAAKAAEEAAAKAAAEAKAKADEEARKAAERAAQDAAAAAAKAAQQAMQKSTQGRSGDAASLRDMVSNVGGIGGWY
ncbi:MAG: hypothetical protein CMB45_05265 [Euryarchaeota archaeon]|nr:hypothetical protein [Euryarchaeota archaeon]MBK38382.1 hypothetical protein [Euryarchaeota archaeon]|tara:strand:+ start:59609 stop:60817 length:1209 start_codon:yes stop_codon:yes gene_type:complete